MFKRPIVRFIVSLVLSLGSVLVMGQMAQAFWPFSSNDEDTTVSQYEKDFKAIDVEWVYYNQYRFLDAQFDSLAPEIPGKRDLYVIGVAGYGWQDIFRKEIEAISTLIGEHFDTSKRTIKLINNKDTLEKYPIANYYNLEDSIHKIAETMNVEEDVLLITMTSHGSPGLFSTWFPPVSPNSITPSEIRSMLDNAGIKHRVIVIQACYSGSFIKELEGPNTLVITAAREDRTSFGCSDDRDWTYFNKAYYDEAFRKSPHFIEAFSTAKELVARWEKDLTFDGVQQSLPQISIGENIEITLRELESGYIASQRKEEEEEAEADLAKLFSD